MDLPRFLLLSVLGPFFAYYSIWRRWEEVQHTRAHAVDPSVVWEQRWHDGLGLYGLGILFVLAIVVAGVWFLPKLRREPPPAVQPLPVLSAWAAYLLVAQFTVFLVLSPLVSMKVSQVAIQGAYSLWLLAGLLLNCGRRLSWNWRPGWWRWGLSAYALTLLGASLYGILAHPEPSVNPVAELFVHAGLLERLAWIVILCVLTPLVEEGWYRGVLSGPSWARALLIAVVFGLVHADPSALLPLIWMGLVFNWACWKGCLPAAVLAHALWNATVSFWYLGALGGA